MYNVVFRNISDGRPKGVVTWSSFSSQNDFEMWYDDKMRREYEVVAKNVSDERTVELCSTADASQALFSTLLGELYALTDELEELVSSM